MRQLVSCVVHSPVMSQRSVLVDTGLLSSASRRHESGQPSTESRQPGSRNASRTYSWASFGMWQRQQQHVEMRAAPHMPRALASERGASTLAYADSCWDIVSISMCALLRAACSPDPSNAVFLLRDANLAATSRETCRSGACTCAQVPVRASRQDHGWQGLGPRPAFSSATHGAWREPRLSSMTGFACPKCIHLPMPQTTINGVAVAWGLKATLRARRRIEPPEIRPPSQMAASPQPSSYHPAGTTMASLPSDPPVKCFWTGPAPTSTDTPECHSRSQSRLPTPGCRATGLCAPFANLCPGLCHRLGPHLASGPICRLSS